MTSKEKANELHNKFIDASIVEEEENYHHPKTYALAKQCALVAVKEISSLMIKFHGRHIENNLSEIYYWDEVKSEIEKL